MIDQSNLIKREETCTTHCKKGPLTRVYYFESNSIKPKTSGVSLKEILGEEVWKRLVEEREGIIMENKHYTIE